ncbi:MAG TPA: DUF5681 domain-containing protein [Stellaceae bacterium]|jgi:hypothetical protein|nr:DUF5681 domain-containing protein [Stellaceae bacterium]
MQQKGLPRGRPFERGQSGNPAGRLLGSRNHATMFAQALLDNDLEILMKQTIDRALKGDPLALKLCIERILAPQRQAKVRIELPPLKNAEDATRAFAAIAAAVAEGELAPGEARDLSLVPHGFLRALDAHDFEQRLTALESKTDRE